MKNFFYYLTLFYNLLIKDKNQSEMSVIVDDSGSHEVNTKIIRNICRLGIFFNLDICVYQGKQIFTFNTVAELDSYIKNFSPWCGDFNLNKILAKVPGKSFKVLYSDFHLDNSEVEQVSKIKKISLVANDRNSLDDRNLKHKIYKLSA